MKRAGLHLLNILFLITLSSSCKKKISTKDELIAYINNPENGLIKVEEVNKIKAELRYKPWQLMKDGPHILQTQAGNKHNEDVLKNKYFFVLSLSTGNKELLRQLPYAQYSEMVQVLAFRMMNYVDVIPDDKKSVGPEDCLFQQTYGMARANQLLLVFDKAKLESAKDLHIRIKEFGLGTGDLNFQISTHDINDLPPEVTN